MKSVTMYRPCGKDELQLVINSGYKKWPPRLVDQPIFYPVTNEQYAKEVNNWNVKSKGIGYVTKFEVRKQFIDNYKIHTVGGRHHTEWWIPAEDLDELNDNIFGLIEVIGEYTSVV
ncbi:MAG: hypothetical protein HWE27_10210 [Gammaproteobacteria bacterium]|nr:hypothetical protein [Gammaproteobacteria bacterium]